MQDASTMVLLYRYILDKAGMAKAWLLAASKTDEKGTTNANTVSAWKQAQEYVRLLVEHSFFSQLFMALILVNTIAMYAPILGNIATPRRSFI